MDGLSLSLVEIIAIITLAGGGIAAWGDIRVKLADVKARITAVEEENEKTDNANEVLRIETQNRFAALVAKSDADSREIMRMLQENNITVIKILASLQQVNTPSSQKD